MFGLTLWPGVLGLSLAVIVVVRVEPVPGSLAYASALLAMSALLGWVLEAREAAGPPPATETEAVEEEQAAGPS